MKIMVDIFKAFLTKLSVKGDIKDCVLDFKDDGVHVLVRNEKSIAVKCMLQSFSFIDYKVIGKLGIRDISRLMTYLNTLKGEIKIKVKDNRLILNDENIFWEYGLCDEEFVKGNLKKFPDYVITKKQVVTTDNMVVMKSLIGSIKTDEMSIISNATHTSFNVNAEQDTGKITIPISFGDDITVLVGESFIKVISVLGNNIEMCLKNNSPLLIEDKSEFMNFEFIVSNKVQQS